MENENGKGQGFYGPFKGIVEDAADPLKSGRIKLKCPEVLGNTAPNIWALPMFGGIKKGGRWDPPRNGDAVWVFFENRDPSFPRWVSGWWGDGDMPDVFKNEYGKTHGWATPEGDYIVMGPSGVKIYQRKGVFIELAGSAITIQAGTIKLKQGGKQVARVGDRAIGTGNHGAPVNSRIISGSSAVTAG